jgi:mannosyl-oligosaccharide alpha-1,2-mannosidase
MIAIGAKVFDRPEELHIARKLVDGCIWGYTSTPSGIMPEAFHLASCSDLDECKWDEDTWHDALDAENHYRRGLRGAQIAEQDRLPEGYTSIIDRRYLLRSGSNPHRTEYKLTLARRPEVIESVFILYRITGDPELQDAAWHMFTAIHNATLTDTGYSAIADVTALPGKEAGKLDSCESFWFAETLKYFYLIFSDPHLVSLDEYVL